MYRRCYIEGLIALVVTSIISPIIPFGGLIVWITYGFVNTFLIYKRYKRVLTQCSTKSDAEKIQYLQIKGGINKILATIAGICSLLGLIIIVLLFLRAC